MHSRARSNDTSAGLSAMGIEDAGCQQAPGPGLPAQPLRAARTQAPRARVPAWRWARSATKKPHLLECPEC